MIPPQKTSPLLRLPPELRLQIYSYILDIQTPYTSLLTTHSNHHHHNRPLIIINDTGNKFTTRPLYRSLHISPAWVGLAETYSSKTQSKKARAGLQGPLSLLAVNHQIHDEVEDYLYSTHTLFFLNSFDLDSLGPFLDTLSTTARARIRYIGFEVYLFVHNGANASGSNTPKRTFRQYERAARVLEQKLPSLTGVVFYFDPWFAACVGGADGDGAAGFGPWCNEKEVLGRGVGFLGRVFGTSEKGMRRMEMDFLPEGIVA
jgi:ubiquitin-like-conjugating enzyme ATG3